MQVHQISLGLIPYMETWKHPTDEFPYPLMLAGIHRLMCSSRRMKRQLLQTLDYPCSTAVLVSGTKRWMSPERMKGKQLATPVDIYAWAMTTYEASSPFAQWVIQVPKRSIIRFLQVWSHLVPRTKVYSFARENGPNTQTTPELLKLASPLWSGHLWSAHGPQYISTA